MDVKIKICGLTSLADARYCAGAGADYLGFIQHPESPRYIAPDQAREIIDWLYGPTPVGVFVDADADTVNRTADAAGFELVQLHGDEPPALCRAVERPVIKALRVAEETTAEALLAEVERYAEVADYLLLDTDRGGRFGGTGEAFDWSVAREVAQGLPMFLAGGLTPENVGAAVEAVRPFAVDVSSGVEQAPGVKDFDRLADFFDALAPVRAAD